MRKGIVRMVYYNIESMLGNTPILKLNRLFKNKNIFAKLEYFNPTFSVKDRAAYFMIQKAIQEGKLKPGSFIVEATSGNTGLGLCLASIVFDLKPIMIVFDDVSKEKINLLKAYGATVIICKSDCKSDEIGGYVWLAKNLEKNFKNIFYVDQFNNKDNPLIHYKTTADELWQQLSQKVDFFISTIGTGGTISGVGKFLKEKNPNIKIIGVEPRGGIYHGHFYRKNTVYKDHLIHSISDNFISNNFDTSVVDDIIQVNDSESFNMCYKALRTEGLCIGTSGGCVLAGINKHIRYLNNKNTICIIPDCGIKYCESLYNIDYLKEHKINIEENVQIDNTSELYDIIEYLNSLPINMEVQK